MFMNSENSKTSEPYVLILKLTEKSIALSSCTSRGLQYKSSELWQRQKDMWLSRINTLFSLFTKNY